MLNVALVGLLAGSLLSVNPTGGDGDKDGTKSKKADAQESVVIVGDDVSSLHTITSDTYAYGRTATEAPIKIWAAYGYGEAEQIFNTAGDAVELSGRNIVITNPQTGAPLDLGPSYTAADIVSQRAIFGAEVNPLSFSRFQLGVGAQLVMAKNDLQFGADNQFATNPLTGQPIEIGEQNALSSDFSVQNLKLYASARGKVLGVHAGYILDLGDDPEADPDNPLLPGDLPRSDNRNAINVGVDFDYPITNFRLFGGIDRFIIGENCDAYPTSCEDNANRQEDVFGEEGDGLWNFVLGAGFRVSFFEIGAAAQLAARDRQPVERNEIRTIGTTENIGGYVSTISPYVKISPPSLPASLFVQGGVLDEYNTYGLGIDGSNGPKPTIGFTAGLTIGFE